MIGAFGTAGLIFGLSLAFGALVYALDEFDLVAWMRELVVDVFATILVVLIVAGCAAILAATA